MADLLTFITSNNEGVTEEQITEKFPNLSKKDIAKHLNQFLKSKQIEIHNNGTSLIYKKITSLIDEERIIYQLIADSKGKGLWLRDIKLKSSIPQTLISKLLRQMENKKMIKSVKTVKSNRKVYILYDDKPSEELTGGVWFSDGEIDKEFVNEMIKVVYEYLCKKCPGYLVDVHELPDLYEIQRFLENSKISKVQISNEDLETLMKIMVYDELIQEIVYEDSTYYRVLPRKNK